ncbi:MAG: tetraacyldisaccharide 4'-kinase [Microbacter sp.]
MKRNSPWLKLFLYPLSWMYGFGVFVRNFLFDFHLLPEESFPIPIISIGNMSVGGTGKTPHTEYIANLLSPHYRVAVLSRGYKRKSKGFLLADEKNASAVSLGDEPYQMFRKLPHCTIAVDANRRRGIRKLLELKPDLQVILLDDAFQHRYVKPKASILLTNYSNLFTEDSLLPYGNLREPANNKYRADIIVVTKCPQTMQPVDYKLTLKKLDPLPFQTIYFTFYRYSFPYALFEERATASLLTDEMMAKKKILIVSGIANPTPLARYVASISSTTKSMFFSDHYRFKGDDYARMASEFAAMQGEKCVLVTEKDAARMKDDPLVPEALKPHLFVLPVRVEFIKNQYQFNHQILSYVSKNQ